MHVTEKSPPPVRANGSPCPPACLVLVIAYIVTGKLALLLALPPGYASAIFPPAGIAVAAALIGGKRTLPWTFLGSLLLNLWVSHSPSRPLSLDGTTAAVLIAVASMLQAALGGWLLRRAIGYPSPFDKASDVLRLLLLAPTICLVSASLSVSLLTLLGIFDAAQAPTNWAAWWIGDTLGVIVMLPLILVVAGEPRMLWRRRELTVAVPMLLAFTLFVFVFVKANRWEREESLMAFRAQALQIAEQMQTRFEEQEFLLEQAAGFLSHDLNKTVTRSEFQRYAASSLKRFPALQAIEWAPQVVDQQRQRFEAEQRADLADFAIRQRDGAGKLRPAAERPVYYPVTYAEPTLPNLPALGFDLASTADRRQTVGTTQERKISVATPPLHLVQVQPPQPGILLMLAVDHGGKTPGIVLSAMRVADFVDQTLPHDRSLFRVRLSDIAQRQTIYDSFDGDVGDDLLEHILNFGTRQYRLEFVPTQLYLTQHRGWQSWTVLAVGLFGTGLLGALLLLGTGHTARVEALVQDRTAALLRTETLLKEAQRMTKIGSWELDIGRNKLTWSEEIYRIFEIDPAAFDASYDAFLQAVHPDDRAMVDNAYTSSLQSKAPYEIDHRLLFADGRIKHVHERCETFYDGAGKPLRSIGTVQDVTAAWNAEEQIRQLAYYDTLTDLPNRRLLLDRINQSLSQAVRYQRSMAVMFLDLDRFKSVNDTLGHEIGDELLRAAAQRLNACVRTGDTVSRQGGDEFVLVLAEIAQQQDAARVAEKIIEAFSQPVVVDGHALQVTVSIGIAVYQGGQAGDAQELLKRADMAMYSVKQAGRNGYRFYQA